MRNTLTVTCLLAFTQFAMAQSASPDASTDAVTVRISEDGVCYFLDDSAPCEELGKHLLTKHLPENTHIHFAVDRASKYELVAATLESLEGTGFKLGFVNDDAPASPNEPSHQLDVTKPNVKEDGHAIQSHPIRLGEQYYPPESRRLGEQGTCLVKITVTAEGEIRDRSLTKKPPQRRTDYSEPGRTGFQLRHWPGGALTFVLRYLRDGREVPLTLGSYPAMSLEQAHTEHADARKLLGRGIDPQLERDRAARAQKAQEQKDRQTTAVTVRNVIAEWAWHYARRHRKRPREAVRLLRVNLATWAGKPARDLAKRDAVLLLDRITARGSLVMANRIRDLGSQAFNFAIERDLIELNPFTGIRKPGGAEEPKERNLNADEIRASWLALASPDIEMSRTVRLALKLILVTAQRPGEVIGAAWSEFSDLESKSAVWRIPPERSKNGKPHDVPLSDLAVEILSELRALTKDRPRLHIAPSVHSKLKADEPLSERALSRALRNNHDDDGKLFGIEPFTPHDLRRSAATCMTSLGIARLHVAKVLNHSDREITAIYDRHDYAPEKRAALQTWGDELRLIIADKQRKVVPLHANHKRQSPEAEIPLRPGERRAGAFAVDDTRRREAFEAPAGSFRRWIDDLPRRLSEIESAVRAMESSEKIPGATARAMLDGVQECSMLLERVRGWLSRERIELDEIPAAMGHAAALQAAFAAIPVNEAEQFTKAGWRSFEGGKRGGRQRHANEAAEKAELWSKIERYVSTLVSLENTRADILAKTSRKFRVNASTIEKNLSVLALLRGKRRNSTR